MSLSYDPGLGWAPAARAGSRWLPGARVGPGAPVGIPRSRLLARDRNSFHPQPRWRPRPWRVGCLCAIGTPFTRNQAGEGALQRLGAAPPRPRPAGCLGPTRLAASAPDAGPADAPGPARNPFAGPSIALTQWSTWPDTPSRLNASRFASCELPIAPPCSPTAMTPRSRPCRAGSCRIPPSTPRGWTHRTGSTISPPRDGPNWPSRWPASTSAISLCTATRPGSRPTSASPWPRPTGATGTPPKPLQQSSPTWSSGWVSSASARTATQAIPPRSGSSSGSG